MYTHSTVKLNWFDHNCTDSNILSNIPNTPDIVLINETSKSVTILEIGCSFDLYMDICFTSKLVKYQPLVECITSLGYHCKLIVLVFGSLGHVHRLAVRGLQNGGMQKADAKRLAKFCSVSQPPSLSGGRNVQFIPECPTHLLLLLLLLFCRVKMSLSHCYSSVCLSIMCI